jgi:hypothetical protein
MLIIAQAIPKCDTDRVETRFAAHFIFVRDGRNASAVVDKNLSVTSSTRHSFIQMKM